MAERPWTLPRLLRRRLRCTRERRGPGSVRARATLAASGAVALALAVASLAMLSLLRTELQRSAEEGTWRQAVAVAKLAGGGRLASVVPLADGVDFIQVVDADGRVVASSPNVAGRPALSSVKVAAGGGAVKKVDLGPFGVGFHEQVTSIEAATPKGQVMIHAGVSLTAADHAESTTALILAVGCPLLLGTVALVTWRVTGRALRPVEAIRTEVAAIGEQALHRRVPIPRGDDEIARLATTMNSMLDRLDAAGRRQRQFIADASHELRSPITVVRTQLEVALAHPDPEVRLQLTEGALQDAERLQELAADLLFLARLDSGAERAADPEPVVELDELVRATVRARPAERCPVGLDLCESVQVPGNRLWLARMLTNLLDNAQRHARGAVTVRLYAEPGTDEAVLEVHNDGPSIRLPDRRRIFERFTRLDDARSRDDGGAGLGLPIALDIARHHGGALAVTDSPAGATFQARLPLQGRGPLPVLAEGSAACLGAASADPSS